MTGVAPAFAPVADAFAAHGAGSQLVVVVRDRLAVDLADGVDPDALVHLWSAGKPVAALAVLHLVGQGRLALDDPVVRHWPSYGDEATTVRHLLAHGAGRASFPEGTTVDDLVDEGRARALLQSAPPTWRPGTAVGEHALTYGTLLGGLVRSVDGRSLGTLLREEVLPGRDVRVGVPDADLARCADLHGLGPSLAASVSSSLVGDRPWPAGLVDGDVVNSRRWRQAEVAAVNAHASARALAQLYADLLAGRLPPAPLRAEAVRVQASGVDRVLGRQASWGLGFSVDDAGWGMGGVGGTSAWADPRSGVAFAFVTTRMGTHERADALEEVVVRCSL